jgi:hypothetical protein
MSRSDKVIASFFLIAGLAVVAYGLYLVGNNGVLLLVGTMLFYFITDIFRTVEIELVTKDLVKKTDIRRPEREAGTEAARISQAPAAAPAVAADAAPAAAPAVGAAANDNNDLIRNIINKQKRNPQQDLLSSMMGGGAPAPTEDVDAEQARIDHEILVEHFKKKEEAFRNSAPTETVDNKVQQDIIKRQREYVDGLMEPTIIPQRNLAEKTEKE